MNTQIECLKHCKWDCATFTFLFTENQAAFFQDSSICEWVGGTNFSEMDLTRTPTHRQDNNLHCQKVQ